VFGALVGFVACVAGCGDMLSDPAVRVAECLEAAARAGERTVKCDLKLSGRYVVILYPNDLVLDADLRQAGVPDGTIPELRALRLGPQEAVFVIPLDHQDRPSRTTYQGRFVSISELLVKVGSDSSVTLDLQSNSSHPRVVGIR
jgi:hypothetical protein